MSMKRIAVFTSGGDAQGMNAAVRAVVRTALDNGIGVYAIYEGYQGMVDGKKFICQMNWDSVGGILQRGGTMIGSARSADFRTREGRMKAAKNLIEREINGLVVIGGDGSLTGANIFREEWSGLLAELVEKGEISQETADQNTSLAIVGLTGSIDNDMYGTDMTIGADTALHRITEAIDAISSTASSHQRSFVVEVMGRNCGYLALMGALASGADWVLIPESPPDPETWADEMCSALKKGREMGRRDSVVVVAEGARDRDGNPITCAMVKNVLEEKLGEDTRITILGHVQRGGAPSAFDRNLGTLLGNAAVESLLDDPPGAEPQLIGMRGNRIVESPLMQCVRKTQSVAETIAEKDFDQAMELRGSSFKATYETFLTLTRVFPDRPDPGEDSLRLAVMHSGAPAPGMNTAARTAIRIGIDRGHTMLGIQNGFEGFIEGEIKELDWMSVTGWANRGGAELGTNRHVPEGRDLYLIARNIERYGIQGLLIIGGWSGYQGAFQLFNEREDYPNFNIPILCLPATIDNDLPGSELSIGADTALNSIVEAVDKIKQSAVASRRCFVVEVMGGYCGYLALMSGLATGAERVYLHEDNIGLVDLQSDLEYLITGFKHGKRLGLMIRNERAHDVYTTDFIVRLFEAEGGDLFDVRQAILGHLQQGGNPSPFDRVQASRLATQCIDYLIKEAHKPEPDSAFIGFQGGQIQYTGLEDYPRMIDKKHARPKEQWWIDLRPIARVLAQPGPKMKK
jgi:6-phosphofructokinase 1